MSTWEPEAWSFSDDEQLFSKMKTLKKKKFKKKVEREKLSFE